MRDLLQEQVSEGGVVPEFAIATEQGVKVPGVIWTSPERREEMEATGDPTMLAPELCVEGLSDTNTEEEMQQKRSLYLQAGAEEVWVVDREGRVRFFGEAEMEHSSLVPHYPSRV